jgi:hypothetical protein
MINSVSRHWKAWFQMGQFRAAWEDRLSELAAYHAKSTDTAMFLQGTANEKRWVGGSPVKG